MDIDYSEVVNLSLLKDVIKKSGYRSAYIAEALGIRSTRVASLWKGVSIPKTDAIAKLCFILKVSPSQIVTFKDIELNEYFNRPVPYTPPENATGELTYAPLWNFIEEYLKDKPGKTYHDLFDKIEPYRRRNNIGHEITDEERQKSAVALNIRSEEERAKRVVHKEGLTEATRTKLHKDRPVNIRTVYDICKFLGCPIDWVLSYK